MPEQHNIFRSSGGSPFEPLIFIDKIQSANQNIR